MSINIQINILDNLHNPISKASIILYLVGQSFRGLTDDTGKFTFTNLPVAASTLCNYIVSADGYTTNSNWSIISNLTAFLNIELNPTQDSNSNNLIINTSDGTLITNAKVTLNGKVIGNTDSNGSIKIRSSETIKIINVIAPGYSSFTQTYTTIPSSIVLFQLPTNIIPINFYGIHTALLNINNISIRFDSNWKAIVNLSPGTYSYTIQKQGFITVNSTINIIDGKKDYCLPLLVAV